MRKLKLGKRSTGLQPTHKAGNVIYRSKQMASLHRELEEKQEKGIIKSFHLPAAGEKEPSKNKLGASKCNIDGFRFDSVMEGRYYVHLLEELEKGIIKKFSRQVKFELQPAYINEITGKKISAISYIADFVIEDAEGRIRVVDVKGFQMPEFKLKKKVFGFKYPRTEFLCLQLDQKSGQWVNLEEKKKERRKQRV